MDEWAGHADWLEICSRIAREDRELEFLLRLISGQRQRVCTRFAELNSLRQRVAQRERMIAASTARSSVKKVSPRLAVQGVAERGGDRGSMDAKEFLEPAQEQAEVVAGGRAIPTVASTIPATVSTPALMRSPPAR